MTAYPLIDLHRHLEGSLRPSHLVDVLGRSVSSEDTIRGLRRMLTADESTDSLVSYLKRIDHAAAILTEAGDWVHAGANAVEDAYDDGLDYLELRFSPWFVARQTGLHPRAVVDAVSEGVAAASARTGMPAGLIAIVLRNLGPESADKQIDTILETRDVWCAIDLAGDEAGVPCVAFAPAFARARDAGLHITVHAGEAAGPQSVADAMNHLGAERIGHGVRSVEDPRLLERLRERDVTLEVALTSNTQTRASTGFESHQIHDLLAAGVAVTLNTDNPTPSHTRLSEEYRRAEHDAHIPLEALRDIAARAAQSSFTARGRNLAT
ncbi:adenosine deaminase [Agromyces sp. NPDC049794]|uniref:adenosine deaminase n=1 Tax=unclassified Agromyces TaxID=2639701 RepID=UPI0033D3CCFE